MRSEVEVEEYTRIARAKLVYCCKQCKGSDPECVCNKRYNVAIQAYEACVPVDFWHIKPRDVTHNKNIFKEVVQTYVRDFDKVLRHGYSLLLLGDNGAGKTYFLSYVLMEAIKAGRTVYYTTLPSLYYQIKRGFKEQSIEDRLDWMLTSDIVAIDEVGKEQRKKTVDSDSSYIAGELERILKQRCDDAQPVLLGSNMGLKQLQTHYGSTIESLLMGKYRIAQMKPGDFRQQLARKMAKDMGY